MYAKGKSRPLKVRKDGSVSSFDELAQEYDAWFDREGSLIFLNEVRGFRTLLPSLPKPWLEIGVGSGRFAQALGIETGIDPSENLVEIAKSRGINALVGRGEVETFDAQSFKAVFIILTLCFLDSPLDVLKEANRILAPDGKIILGMVLAESPWGKLYRQKKKEDHRFYRYARFYDYDEVTSLSEQAGFKVEKTISTLFQEPGNVNLIEEPVEGFSQNAGFTIIVGGKQTRLSRILKTSRNEGNKNDEF
jgi:SAM-dependent methyltransferase